ncbi:MAG: acylphosphatase [Simkaniaceae bacterium]|nr:acylphosphatase [Simkaniaceae bacterium]
MLILKITGDIQGVGFRATARRIAKQLNLKGYAKNMPDGSVEILVQGSLQEAEQILDGLRNFSFNIDSATITESSSDKSCSDFLIL